MNAADASVTQFDGTVVDNAAPDSNEYTASGTSINAGEGGTHVIGSATATNLWLPEAGWTSVTNGVHLLFKPHDLIRVNNEIMEVTEVGSGVNGTSLNYLTVIRGVHGSTAVDTHSADDAIRFPFFNTYKDYNKYTVAQSDASGGFSCQNFFGVGRGASGAVGLVPGSLSIKFYSPGFQKLGMSSVTSSTNTGLTVSTEYGFDISVDGAGINSDNMKFTTDSSNVNWGGTNGVMSKIQEVLDEQFYTTASPINGKKAVIGIENGDIVFRSGQSLSSSAMLLAAPSGGETTPFGVGAIPAIGDISSPVAARLDADVIYDNVTNAAIPNSSVFAYDDGFGRLSGKCSGTINYESGAINMIGCPPNAEFVYSVAHSSAFSGKLGTATTDVGGTLTDILVNTPNNKWSGSVTLKEYA